ncbi:hypothetical protein [Hymenobacter nivis]|uniref:DUF3592 domain-containing protein n=1 Tax=Hymenobacter nivis TaxID=1850093 RepID=A0A2Z3GRB8_9BACT|nr:hypothetical protein [Hymenobacter nivis]AWM33886.1 hypothetical protein DDQ68_14455 [Hymenobacter nivis]
MLKYYAVLFAFFATALPSLGQAFAHTKGQEFLYFRKNGHREAVYGIGDVVTFELKGTGAKVSDQIKGFQDSLVVFEAHVLNPSKIGAIYVDAKTKQWFILRYKYEKVFFLASAFFLPIDIVNTGKIEPQALAISGALLGVGLLAKWLISKKLKIKGKRKLLVIAY